MFVSPFCDGIPSGRLVWVKAPFGVVSILLLPECDALPKYVLPVVLLIITNL